MFDWRRPPLKVQEFPDRTSVTGLEINQCLVHPKPDAESFALHEALSTYWFSVEYDLRLGCLQNNKMS